MFRQNGVETFENGCAGAFGISLVGIQRVSCRLRFIFPIAMAAILLVKGWSGNMIYPISEDFYHGLLEKCLTLLQFQT